MTLDDDEEIEILHDSPAAAEESAPHIPPDSVSDVPESGSALAKQVEATLSHVNRLCPEGPHTFDSLSREAASPHDSGVATLLTFNSGHCIHLQDAVPVLLIVLALRSLHLSTLQSTYTFGDKEMGLQGDWVKELEDEMSCAVCQDTIVAAHSLVPCGHCFCGTCLFQWLSRKQICPTCRSVPAILAGLSSVPLLVLD